MTYFEVLSLHFVQPLGHNMKPSQTLDAWRQYKWFGYLHIAAKTNQIVRFYVTTGGIQNFI
jgi:hypothetical protein